MTRKEFEKMRLCIEEEPFSGNYTDPIEFGLQRAAFEKKKFQKLISAARRVNFRTTRAKVEQWRRQLERAEQSCERFRMLKHEMKAARLQIDPASIPVANSQFQSRP